jgi:hypothetical protein
MKDEIKELIPQEHSSWPSFVEWATQQGVNLEDEGDWGLWWDCFFTGYLQGAEDWNDN